mmetsp:Transcript_26868/g.32553  ORF Transcript_26868/g.32553 Transcript_26868/m.32553 type:complete len:97 (-) Transcript_26868:698-988(-)
MESPSDPNSEKSTSEIPPKKSAATETSVANERSPQAKDGRNDNDATKPTTDQAQTQKQQQLAIPIKKARTAYFIFADDKRAEIRAAVSDKHRRIKL